MYQLKTAEPEVDLAHIGTVRHWLTEKRDNNGRWTVGGGKHLEIKSHSQRDIKTGDEGMETVDYNDLFAKVTDDSLPLEERERLVNQATMHLRNLQKKVETANETVSTRESELHLKGAFGTVDRTFRQVNRVLKPKEEKKAGGIKGFVEDSYKDTARVDMTTMAIKVGAAASAGAASLIGVHESERFSEAFEKLTEYPGVESAINMALTLLITGLVARIVAKWKKVRAAKIAAHKAQMAREQE